MVATGLRRPHSRPRGRRVKRGWEAGPTGGACGTLPHWRGGLPALVPAMTGSPMNLNLAMWWGAARRQKTRARAGPPPRTGRKSLICVGHPEALRSSG